MILLRKQNEDTDAQSDVAKKQPECVPGRSMNGDPPFRHQNAGNCQVETFHCPSDRGDFLRDIDSVWDDIGNSYRVAWWNAFRVKRVIGVETYRKGSPEATAITESEVALKASTKIIQGDWIWHGNRGVDDKKSTWHNFKGQVRYAMLFVALLSSPAILLYVLAAKHLPADLEKGREMEKNSG